MAVAANMNAPKTSYPPFVPSQSQAQWAKPQPKVRRNFIPAQSYLTYNWDSAVDKDPDLEFVLFAIEQSGWSVERIEYETERAGHKISRYTLLGWFYKGVRRPQNSTISTVMSALGWERPWQQKS
jgi:hypothetical protein